MDNIKAQIVDAIGEVPLNRKPVAKVEVRSNFIKMFLNTKEVLHIDDEKEEMMLNWEPNPLLPEYQKYYNELTENDKPEQDYSDLKDAYQICELFSDTRRVKVTADYLRWIKTTDTGFIINIYGGNRNIYSSYGEDIWKLSRYDGKFSMCDLPDNGLATPNNVTYTTIGEPIYKDKVYIDEARDAVAVLAIDVPFAYFSKQNIKGNIYTIDMDTKEYQIGGLPIKEINHRLYSLATSGIKSPLVMRINEGLSLIPL